MFVVPLASDLPLLTPIKDVMTKRLSAAIFVGRPCGTVSDERTRSRSSCPGRLQTWRRPRRGAPIPWTSTCTPIRTGHKMIFRDRGEAGRLLFGKGKD